MEEENKRGKVAAGVLEEHRIQRIVKESNPFPSVLLQGCFLPTNKIVTPKTVSAPLQPKGKDMMWRSVRISPKRPSCTNIVFCVALLILHRTMRTIKTASLRNVAKT